MSTTTGIRTRSTRLPSTDRIRLAGLAGIVGGVLYALVFLENDLTPVVRESLATAAGVLLGATGVLLVAVALNGFHAAHRDAYDRVGAGLVALGSITLAAMAVGNVLNLLLPGVADPTQADATLGSTVWGLAMFATLFTMTGYGVVLWHAGVVRTGAVLLAANLVLFVAGVVALNALAGVVGYNAAWIAFGGPLGLAWIVLGRSLLRGEGATTATTA